MASKYRKGAKDGLINVVFLVLEIGGVSNHLEAGAYLVPGSHPGLNQVPGDLAMAGLGLRGSSAPSTEDPLNNPSLQLPHLGVPASQLDPKMPTQLPQVLQSPGTPLSPPRRQSLYGATLSSSHLQQQQGQQLRHPQGASQLGSAQHQQQIMSSTMPQQLQHQLNQTSLGPQQEVTILNDVVICLLKCIHKLKSLANFVDEGRSCVGVRMTDSECGTT